MLFSRAGDKETSFSRAGDKETSFSPAFSFLIPIRRSSYHYYSARALSAAGYRPADLLLFPEYPSIPGTPDTKELIGSGTNLGARE